MWVWIYSLCSLFFTIIINIRILIFFGYIRVVIDDLIPFWPIRHEFVVSLRSTFLTTSWASSPLIHFFCWWLNLYNNIIKTGSCHTSSSYTRPVSCFCLLYERNSWRRGKTLETVWAAAESEFWCRTNIIGIHGVSSAITKTAAGTTKTLGLSFGWAGIGSWSRWPGFYWPALSGWGCGGCTSGSWCWVSEELENEEEECESGCRWEHDGSKVRKSMSYCKGMKCKK